MKKNSFGPEELFAMFLVLGILAAIVIPPQFREEAKNDAAEAMIEKLLNGERVDLLPSSTNLTYVRDEWMFERKLSVEKRELLVEVMASELKMSISEEGLRKLRDAGIVSKAGEAEEMPNQPPADSVEE